MKFKFKIALALTFVVIVFIVSAFQLVNYDKQLLKVRVDVVYNYVEQQDKSNDANINAAIKLAEKCFINFDPNNSIAANQIKTYECGKGINTELASLVLDADKKDEGFGFPLSMVVKLNVLFN